MQMNNNQQPVNSMPVMAAQNTQNYLKSINPYRNMSMPYMQPLVYNGSQILPASQYFQNNATGYQMYPSANMFGYSMQNTHTTSYVDNKQIQYPTYNAQGMLMQNYIYYNQMNACKNIPQIMKQNNPEIDENSTQSNISDNINNNGDDNDINDTQNNSKSNFIRIVLNKTQSKNDEQNQNGITNNLCQLIKQSDSYSSLSSSTQQLFPHSDKFEINTKQEDNLDTLHNSSQESSTQLSSIKKKQNKIDSKQIQQCSSSQKIETLPQLNINVKESKKNEENLQQQQNYSIQNQSLLQIEKLQKEMNSNSQIQNKNYNKYNLNNNNNQILSNADYIQRSQSNIENKTSKVDLKNDQKCMKSNQNSQNQQQRSAEKEEQIQNVLTNNNHKKQNKLSLQMLPQEVYNYEQNENQILINDESDEIQIEDEEEFDQDCQNKNQTQQKTGKKLNTVQKEIQKIQKNLQKIILKKLFNQQNSLKLIQSQLEQARKKLFSNCTLNEFSNGFTKNILKQLKGTISVSKLDRIQEHLQLKIHSASEFLNYIINHEILSSVFIKYIILPIDKYTSLIKPEQQVEFQKIINKFTQNVFSDISKMEYVSTE